MGTPPYGCIARSAVQVWAGRGVHIGGFIILFLLHPLTKDRRPSNRRDAGKILMIRFLYDSISYFLALLSTTSRSRAVKSSRDMAPRSPSVRCRGETVPFSMSRSPTTTM